MVAGCKSSERPKFDELYLSAVVASSTSREEKNDSGIVPEIMDAVPSTSTWSDEDGLPPDLFISWKKDTVGTICDKLSERQRSAFIFVSSILLLRYINWY